MANKVIIVGGGIVGLMSAFYLNLEGWEVTVLDKGDFSDNCSYGNAGMIVPSHFTPLATPGIISQGIRWMFNSKSPFYVKPSLNFDLINWGLKFIKSAKESHVEKSSPYLRDLNLYSSELYNELSEIIKNTFELEKKGILMLYKTQKTEEEEVHLAQKARDLGLDAEVLSRQQLKLLEPDLNLDVLGGVHYKCDGHLNPTALMSGLLAHLRSAGVRLIPNQQVCKVAKSPHKILSITTLSGEEYKADQYVFANGASLQELSKKTKLTVPVMPGKGYSFFTKSFQQKLKHPAILIEAKVALTPMQGKVRIGGTMELAAINTTINKTRVIGIVESIPHYFSGIEVSFPEDIWYGFRPCSPDGLPYLGKSKTYGNLILAGGLGMMGLSLGPAVGKVVSDLANDKSPQPNIEIFNPERFN